MEAAYPAPSPVDAEAWATVHRPTRVFRVRRSVIFAVGYFLFQSMLLFVTEADGALGFARILGPLLLCLLYGYLVRSEEKHQSANELQTLAARAENLMEELKQRAAERVLLLEEIERQRELLEKAQRVKEQFLSVLSHELRTPLNIVMGYARLLKERMLGDLDPIQADAISKIISHARDQLGMVVDILEVTNMNAGEAGMRSQEIALSGLMEDLKADHELPQRKNLELVWDYPEDLPVVKTDGEKLKHMLRNLIDNAIKFTYRGTVTISARNVAPAGAAASNKKYIEFRIVDTGIGIAPQHLPRIFDLFHQIDGSTTRSYGGVGMGLYVVKRLAELLGATVDVESAPDEGSIFTISLSCDAVAQARVDKRPRPPRSTAVKQVALGL
ncbi:MAG TPA: HAMP domain-containing sensor histidine kinase [Verrucomicrobiae bacterium]|jgi:signal transduction histidine kinase|nr:HAMP domain-containing sensor histidine kinase [Verrucomicrobiae bacterium]